MIRELFYKWFGIDAPHCPTCEVLQTQLEIERAEKRQLLEILLNKDKPIEVEQKRELVPILPQFVPWRVRQQMLEAEDRKRAQVLREKEKELAESKRSEKIEELEKELAINEG